ncbi:MAG: methyltransferase [Chlorobiales bacterium]|jgi:hypothetical protein|nr:methyltransferase [Chlorobiales bacterium]
MTIDLEKIDRKALERLRTIFLQGSAGATDYWQTESDLENYDITFAQRIRWKWNDVLAGLATHNWQPPNGTLIDWGCGSGVASRAFLERFGTDTVSDVLLWDRSVLAMQVAEKKVSAGFPGVPVRRYDGRSLEKSTVLISHVITELSPAQLAELLTIVQSAAAVLWVEPGAYEASRSLIEARTRLRQDFNVVAPCTHQQGCGMLEAQNVRHWCHHFADSPQEVFIDSAWARFAKTMGIDLRQLPLSYLVLDKRPVPKFPSGAVRVIGDARLYKAHALLLGCDGAGVREHRLTKRILPEQFRRLKKGTGSSLQVWQCEGSEIVSSQELGSGS